MRVKKLQLNCDKAVALCVNRKPCLGLEIFPALDGVILPLKSQVCCLGALFDTTATLENQMAAVAWSASALFQLVYQLCPLLVQSDLATVLHALVRSKMDS